MKGKVHEIIFLITDLMHCLDFIISLLTVNMIILLMVEIHSTFDNCHVYNIIYILLLLLSLFLLDIFMIQVKHKKHFLYSTMSTKCVLKGLILLF